MRKIKMAFFMKIFQKSHLIFEFGRQFSLPTNVNVLLKSKKKPSFRENRRSYFNTFSY